MITLSPIIALALPLVIAATESKIIERQVQEAQQIQSEIQNAHKQVASIEAQKIEAPSIKKKATPKASPKQKSSPKVTQILKGKASWYEIKCNGGTETASGIPLKNSAMTAAHKTLPMGTKVRVTNTDNGKSVILKITDRGPYIKGRIIDVTKGAAKKLGFIHKGVVHCKVEVLD